MPPKLKTVRDRFNELVKERRVAVKRNIAASGIAEEHEEMEQLLDSIIEEIDNKAQVLAEEKNQQAQKEKNLRAAAENIRILALKRNAQNIESSTTEKVRLKKKKTMLENNSLNFGNSDTEMVLIEEEIRARRELESKRLELEERRLALDERRQELDAKAQEAQATVRKSELEEKRPCRKYLVLC